VVAHSSSALWTVDLSLVAAAWVLFALIFLLRARSLRPLVRNRDRRSLLGLALEIAGYVVVRAGPRSGAPPHFPGAVGRTALTLAAAVILATSLLLIRDAVTALGKHWSLAAHVVEGHRLVTSGAYSLVRHPIYTGMLGMLIGTALAISTWWALIAGMAVFLIGTGLRIRTEEGLLRAEFGDAYREYARRVPALIPRPPRA
jgi:protein-S-isoprenylcysteine O-methyltransferase Ste14